MYYTSPSLVMLFVECRDSLCHYATTEEKMQSGCSRLGKHLHFSALNALFSTESYLVTFVSVGGEKARILKFLSPSLTFHLKNPNNHDRS